MCFFKHPNTQTQQVVLYLLLEEVSWTRHPWSVLQRPTSHPLQVCGVGQSPMLAILIVHMALISLKVECPFVTTRGSKAHPLTELSVGASSYIFYVLAILASWKIPRGTIFSLSTCKKQSFQSIAGIFLMQHRY